MIYKEAKMTRQSPMQKAAAFGEGALRAIGTAKTIYETGRSLYGAAQAVAPYIASAAALL